MLFHYVNGNEQLETNLLGIPKEPWSASLQGRSVYGRPSWYDIIFKLPEDGDRIVVNLQ